LECGSAAAAFETKAAAALPHSKYFVRICELAHFNRRQRDETIIFPGKFMKIMVAAGTRPDFIKIAPLLNALNQPPLMEPILVHTGQQRDWRMNGLFFQQLAIPDPDESLDSDGSSVAARLTTIMLRFEPMLKKHRPDCVIVVGNVHHAIGCVLIAAEMRIKVIHVDAGLRRPGRNTPEEIDRIMADHFSDLLFCTEQSAVDNLLREGIPKSKIVLAGNVTIDALWRYWKKARASTILPALELSESGYAVLTMHHRPNVQDTAAFSRIISAMRTVGNDMPVVFPMHPRARERLTVDQMCRDHPRIRFIDPLGYLDFLKLISSAKVVFTDSGGVQEETTVLNVPCITLGDSTDRPCTSEMGSNYVVGTDPNRIVDVYRHSQNGGRKTAATPPLWDGCASERIANTIAAMYG
jgi:UDP-N-acetylglucosamine 2-epimerase (non-hydrolysing)